MQILNVLFKTIHAYFTQVCIAVHCDVGLLGLTFATSAAFEKRPMRPMRIRSHRTHSPHSSDSRKTRRNSVRFHKFTNKGFFKNI